MKRAVIFLLFSVFVVFLVSCGGGYLTEVFGIDVRSAEVISNTDTHGGFHGDGERLLVLKFSDETAEKEISEASDWRPLPASEEIAAIIWGVEYDDGDTHIGIGPYNSGEIPEIENGWYSFSDRSPQHSQSGYENDFFSNPPLNYTFAVYDSDEDILYYCEVDT